MFVSKYHLSEIAIQVSFSDQNLSAVIVVVVDVVVVVVVDFWIPSLQTAPKRSARGRHWRLGHE